MIDLTSDDSHPGALLTGCVTVGRLATTRMFAGGLAMRGERASWESQFRVSSWRRETYLIYRRCKLLYETELIVIIICTTQREILATS